jgi:hypothetical protein
MQSGPTTVVFLHSTAQLGGVLFPEAKIALALLLRKFFSKIIRAGFNSCSAKIRDPRSGDDKKE